MNIEGIISAVQKKLGVQVDGRAGTETWGAIYSYIVKPGTKITNARGGYSNHNFAIAFDVGVFEGTKYLSESVKYKAVGVLGMDLGLEWGGHWKTIIDEPHFQLRPEWAADITQKDMLAALRSRTESGTPVFV